MCMSGHANTGGFNHVKHTYVHNLHKQRAYAYSKYKRIRLLQDIKRAAGVLWDGRGVGLFWFTLSFSATRQIVL